MKHSDFEDFAGTPGGRRAAAVLRKHKATPDEIFAMVLAQVTEVLPILEEGGRYTTEMLCGPDIWATWFTAERRVAGMCAAYFVNRKVVKLYKHLTPSGKGKAKYRNTPPPEPVARSIRIVRSRGNAAVRNASTGSLTCL
jgi:hypothetical protein